MSQAVSQFIYFKVKPSVKPEDPANEEGERLLDVLRATKNQSGYKNSAWGRTIEDENMIVWVIRMYSSIPRDRPTILGTSVK